jgi:uncharacterized membrane protein
MGYTRGMFMNKRLTGTMVAMAVAGLFMASSAIAEDAPAKGAEAAKKADQVKCLGVNECKGKGACGGAVHECAGKNECKGKGWIKLTAEECTAKGGTVKS